MTAFPTPPKPPVNASRLQRLFGFRTRLYLTWAALFCLFASFFLSFDLKFSIILDKLPNLVGVHLAPNGFLQGAALTLFLCLCSIVASSVLGFITALGRLSKSAVAFGIASFYASFFRGTPLLIQILLIYLGLPPTGPGARRPRRRDHRALTELRRLPERNIPRRHPRCSPRPTGSRPGPGHA